MNEWPPPQRMGNGRVVIRFGKSAAERRLTRITLGLLVVWIGVMVAIQNRRGVGPLGAGGILMASALYARARGWYVGRLQWVLGLVLLAVGVADLTDSKHHVSWFGLALIVAGFAIVYRAFAGPRR